MMANTDRTSEGLGRGPGKAGAGLRARKMAPASFVTRRLLEREELFPAYWTLLALLALAGDFLAGPWVQFPVFYLLPVILAARYGGRPWGLGLAIGMPLVRAYFPSAWGAPWTAMALALDAGVQVIVLSAIAVSVDLAARRARTVTTGPRVLRGLLPICSICRRIRNHQNTWHGWERYITAHSEAQFTHTICPECLRNHSAEGAEAQR